MKVLDNPTRVALASTMVLAMFTTMIGLAAGQKPATPSLWALKAERTVGGLEADLLVRTGDINNLGFGWPQGFDPFSCKSTSHDYPWDPRPGAPEGTDRIMVGSGVTGGGFREPSTRRICQLCRI